MESLFNPSFIGQTFQTLVLIIGGFIALGAAKQEIRNQGNLILKLDGRIERLEQGFVLVVRQDERLNATDQRILAQGKRLDRVADQVYRNGRRASSEENSQSD